MITCNNCGNKIEGTVEECPFCAYPTNLKKNVRVTRLNQNYSGYMLPRPAEVTALAIFLGLSAILAAWNSIMLSLDGLLQTNEGFLVLLIHLRGFVLSLGVAWGLWHLRNWARILVIIIFGLVGFVTGIMILSNTVLGLLPVLLAGYIVYWFATNPEYFDQPLVPISGTSTTSRPMNLPARSSRAVPSERVIRNKGENEISATEVIFPSGEVEAKPKVYQPKATRSPLTPQPGNWSKRSMGHPVYENRPLIPSLAYSIISVILFLWGMPLLFSESDVRGFYFGICPAFVFFLIGWIASRRE